MSDVIGLVVPFFGLILVGFLAARITRQPLEALGWMNTFVVYIALPALFFQLLGKTPIERLAQTQAGLEASLEALKTYRPAAEKFYAGLTDEQKAKLTERRGKGHWKRDHGPDQKGGHGPDDQKDGPAPGDKG